MKMSFGLGGVTFDADVADFFEDVDADDDEDESGDEDDDTARCLTC